MLCAPPPLPAAPTLPAVLVSTPPLAALPVTPMPGSDAWPPCLAPSLAAPASAGGTDRPGLSLVFIPSPSAARRSRASLVMAASSSAGEVFRLVSACGADAPATSAASGAVSAILLLLALPPVSSHWSLQNAKWDASSSAQRTVAVCAPAALARTEITADAWTSAASISHSSARTSRRSSTRAFAAAPVPLDATKAAPLANSDDRPAYKAITATTAPATRRLGRIRRAVRRRTSVCPQSSTQFSSESESVAVDLRSPRTRPGRIAFVATSMALARASMGAACGIFQSTMPRTASSILTKDPFEMTESQFDIKLCEMGRTGRSSHFSATWKQTEAASRAMLCQLSTRTQLRL
mmetsp:Transcript_8329/g.33748  ORF Transcript_8329/g.33748 Transcript_8329/m.33748 type:complete len:351 (+) Transcript_8329:549-1601(+)